MPERRVLRGRIVRRDQRREIADTPEQIRLMIEAALHA